MTKSTRGGKRIGAGRKPHGDRPKVKFSGVLSREVIEYLASFKPIPRSELIEETIRATAEFSAWLKKSKRRKRTG